MPFPTSVSALQLIPLSRDFLLTQPFPTAMAVLLANMQKGYNTVLVRKGTPTDTPPNEQRMQQYHCIVAVYTFQQINEMNEGSHTDRLGSFATLSCACKSKSHVLCNASLRSLALRKVEATRFGIQAIRPHAPSLGLALEDRVQLLEDGSFHHVAPRTHLDEFNPAPARKMFDRLKSFSRPTFSMLARCSGYNTFILSVMPFSLSCFGLTSKDLNWFWQAASKYILKGSGSKQRYSLISSGMLALPHYLTLRCQRLWLHLVFTFEKAIHWKTSTYWAMMVVPLIVRFLFCARLARLITWVS